MSYDGPLEVDAAASRSALAALQSFPRPDYSSTFTPTLPSGSSSAVREDAGTGEPRLSDTVPEDGRARILQELEGSIASFRKGKTPKTDTISNVLRILGENSDVTLTRAQKEATSDSYLTEILSIQSTFDTPAGGTGGARMESVDQRPPGTGLASAGRSPRRGRDSVEPESDDEDVQPSKRPP